MSQVRFLTIFAIIVSSFLGADSLTHANFIYWKSARICEQNSGYDIQSCCDQAVTGSTSACQAMKIRMDDLVDAGRTVTFKTYTIVTCTVNNIIQNCIIAGQEENSIQILNYSAQYKCHES